MGAHLDKNVVAVGGQQIEMRNLGAQPRLHLLVHLVACFRQLHGQVHVVARESVVGSQCQGPWQEAHKVVLEWGGGGGGGQVTVSSKMVK